MKKVLSRRLFFANYHCKKRKNVIEYREEGTPEGRTIVDRYKKLIKNTGLITLGTFGSKLLPFILIRLYTYVLQDGEYNTADAALYRLLGADLGDKLMLAKESAHEVCERIAHPGADEGY